jgi:hypothetical protein
MLWLAQSNPTGVLPAYRKRTRTLVASNSQMSKIPVLFTCVASAAFALPALAFAQYGGQGLGSALGSDPLSHQGQERPGAEANAAVAPMSSMLFLRSTEQIAKLHLVAELGRIGDAQGALPIMHFLAEPEDERGRGTAVFALGEIGNGKATPLLERVAMEDQSATVRRLAREALRKIGGDLLCEHQKQLASQEDPHAAVPTDQARKASRARPGIAEPGALTLSRIS